MTTTPVVTIYSDLPHEENSLDPRVLFVIEEIDDDETYQRIVHNMPCGLDTEDVLLIASMMNRFFPPTNPFDVAECLGDCMLTVIVNPDTHKLEWESNSTRHEAVGEWTKGENAFGYRPPDRILVEALKSDGTYIRFIDNPTEEMELTAVQRTSAAIEYIKNPSDAMRQLAGARATNERAQARAAFASKYGPGIAPTDGFLNDGTSSCANCGCGINAASDKPEYWVQGVAPLNLFSDLLLCTVMELNSQIGNNNSAADYVHVKEIDGGLMLSFSSVHQLFSMRDVFLDLVAMKSLESNPELKFYGLEVVAYPSAVGTGFVTWGQLPLWAGKGEPSVLT